MSSRSYDGAAALVMVLYQHSRGQYSLFPRSRAGGLNEIALAIMPKNMGMSRFPTWLRAFERSGHTTLRKQKIPQHRWRTASILARSNANKNTISPSKPQA